VNFVDELGRRDYRRVPLETTVKSEAVARLAKLTSEVKVDKNVPAPRSRKVTVATFLNEYWLPYKERQIAAGRFERSTLERYRQDLRLRVLPMIGHLPVTAVSTTVAEEFLLECWTAGVHPKARAGNPAHAPGVYDLIGRMREAQPPYSYQDIALLVGHRFEGESGITRHAVARIWARMRERQSRGAHPVGEARPLAESSVEKIRQMLQGAWRWGMSRSQPKFVDRNVWAEVEPPRAGKRLKPPREAAWQPEHYRAFFTWAAENSIRHWPSWLLAAETGDRRGGIVGIHWDAIDLDEATCDLVFFVELVNNRIVVKDYGKTNGGQQGVPLTKRVVDALRRHKALQAAVRLEAPGIHTCPSAQPYCQHEGHHDRGLVFCAENGEYLQPERLKRQLQRAIARYNRTHADQLPLIHMHALRSGWSSAADTVGVPEAVRMKRLGHSSAQVNRGYTKVFGAAERTAQEAIGDYLFG
jgi:integrase